MRTDMDLDDPILVEIGLAVFRLRRMWAKPDMMRKIREETPGSRPLQLSNLMVVHAVDGLCDEGAAEVTVGAVADRLEIDPSTASRLVGHAIDADLVSRRPSPLDARRANLQLTEAGVRVRMAAERYRRTFLARLMADWTPEDRAHFARLLARFTDEAARFPIDPEGVSKIFEEAEI
jgi:DNA-binding MarR family transcriptional regulator